MNESTSLHSIAGNWDRPVKDGDTGFSFSRLLLGYHALRYSLEYVQRVDIYYKYANETADLLYQTENQLPLPAGEIYPLYIEAKRSRSYGFRLGSEWNVREGVVIGSFISLLNATSLVQGSLSGEAQALSDNDYNFVFNSDMAYDEDPLYSRPGESIEGDGYAVDVDLDYRINDHWHMDLLLLDVLGYLDIPSAPYTIATASSATKHYDENGYVIYDPAIKGREGYRDTRVDFDMQTHLDLTYQLDEVNALSMQYHRFSDYSYQQFEWLINHKEKKYGFIIINEPVALGFSLETSGFYFEFVSDKFDINQSKIVKINLQFIYEFN